MAGPIVKAVAFWGSFYMMYHYARQDELTGMYTYPSYVIFKQKVIRDTWNNGINGEKLSDDLGQFRQ